MRRVPLPSIRRFVRLAGLAALVATHAGVAAAQTPYIPYFGKNNVHYDTFNWSIYTTDHFEIYFYPEVEPHLERIASYAESAYQQISADLKHDLSFKVQLIIFKHTSSGRRTTGPAPAREARRLAESSAHRADRRSAGSPLRPHRSRADAPVRIRHHPADADPAQRAAVGQRRPVRLRARPVGAARPDGRP
jgi:hypothetical protein